MAGLTRGSLPPGVYWRRRLFVLGLVAAMTMLVGGLIRGVTGEPEPTGGGVAEQAAAEPTTSPTDDSSEEPSAGSDKKNDKKNEKSKLGRGDGIAVESNKTPLPSPEGRCAASDVVAEPKVGEAVAGRDVALILKLRTNEAEACRFQLSARMLTLKITSGSDEVWASRHCPGAIPDDSLVLRNESVNRVRLDWNGKRSDEGCSRITQWALPGWYHVSAAAMGGEPTSVKFELETPQAPEPSPKPEKKRSGDGNADDSGDSGNTAGSDREKVQENDQRLHRTER